MHCTIVCPHSHPLSSHFVECLVPPHRHKERYSTHLNSFWSCQNVSSKMPKQSPFPRWLKLLILMGIFSPSLSLVVLVRKKRLSLKRRRGISFRNKKTCSVSSGDFLRGPFGYPIFCVFTCEGRGCWAQGLVDGFYWEKLRWWNLKIRQIFFKTPFWGGVILVFRGVFATFCYSEWLEASGSGNCLYMWTDFMGCGISKGWWLMYIL